MRQRQGEHAGSDALDHLGAEHQAELVEAILSGRCAICTKPNARLITFYDCRLIAGVPRAKTRAQPTYACFRCRIDARLYLGGHRTRPKWVPEWARSAK